MAHLSASKRPPGTTFFSAEEGPDPRHLDEFISDQLVKGDERWNRRAHERMETTR